jgi:hypothetical protein
MDHFEVAVEKRMIEIILEKDSKKVDEEARRRLAVNEEEERRLIEAIATESFDTIKELAGIRKKIKGMPTWVGGSVYLPVALKARSHLVKMRMEKKKTLPEMNTCEEPLYMRALDFTATEVVGLSDTELMCAFTRITGITHLYCSHCKRDTAVDENWSYVIRKRCEKKGLTHDMKIPKTCDTMTVRNDICNPINNKFYPKMRIASTSKDVAMLSALRASEIGHLGLDSKPYKYCP